MTPRTIRLPALAVALGLLLAGCGTTPPGSTTAPGSTATAGPTPTASGSAEPSAGGSGSPTAGPSGTAAPSSSATPAESATRSSSPTTQPTAGGVKATGSLKLFLTASRKLSGSCRTQQGTPTVTVADHANDFFGTVDVTLALSGDRDAVKSLHIDLGEDSESISRTLTYDAAAPASGTSAKLTVAGDRYSVKGKLANVEDGHASGTMPVTLVVTCAASTW